jgi:hypothetical protein
MTREYQASYDEVWAAAIRAFATGNIQIKTIDKSSGLLASDPVRATIGQEIDCGSIEKALGTFPITGTGQGTFNLFIRPQGPAFTVVQVNSSWSTIYREWDIYGRTTFVREYECSSFGSIERGLLGRIAASIRGGN